MRRPVRACLLAAALVTTTVPGADVGPAYGSRGCPRYESLLRAAGLPVGTFSRIMWRESGCQPSARNVNRNGTVDRGLLQLNSIHLRRGGVAHGYAPAALYSPGVNVRLAARLYRRSGLDPWRTR